MKDGTLVLFSGDKTTDKADYSNTPYSKAIASVHVDINGFNKPNEPGKDIFVFILDKNGLLIPYGSSVFNSIFNKHATCKPDSTNEHEIFACTGKIADNGWKADY